MAVGDGVHHTATAWLCLGAALAIQIGTNLANDYYDFKKGTDTAERIGPVRVTQAGLVKPRAIMIGFILAFALAAALSIPLIMRGGWPIAIIGMTAILSGFLYTAGPYPLGYLGLGELFVLIFFGPVAVGGTFYVQSYEINMAVILAGLSAGLISVAILAINNLRDRDSDKTSGKNTLAVRFGRRFAQTEIALSLIVAMLIPVWIYYKIFDHEEILMAVIPLLFIIPVLRRVYEPPSGPALNQALAMTGGILLLFSILFSIGWLL